MKIEEILPYFIEQVNNEKEFKNLQIKLFTKGYKWIDSMNIFTSETIIYPILVSNIPLTNKTEIGLRNAFKEFSNNIIFFSDFEKRYEIVYDKKIIRKVKIQRLSTNVLS